MTTYRITVLDGTPAGAGQDDRPHGSFFGGDPGLDIFLPRTEAKSPVHLVLTLDSKAPQVVALDLGIAPVVRLVYPYYYSESAETFAYHHNADGSVEFTVFPGEEWRDWPSKGLPSAFPTRAVLFEALKDSPGGRGFDDCDPSGIYLGEEVPTVQGYDNNGPACVACSTGGTRLIASVPSRPISELNIWNNDWVFVLFWYCPACKAINAHNECD